MDLVARLRPAWSFYCASKVLTMIVRHTWLNQNNEWLLQQQTISNRPVLGINTCHPVLATKKTKTTVKSSKFNFCKAPEKENPNPLHHESFFSVMVPSKRQQHIIEIRLAAIAAPCLGISYLASSSSYFGGCCRRLLFCQSCFGRRIWRREGSANSFHWRNCFGELGGICIVQVSPSLTSPSPSMSFPEMRKAGPSRGLFGNRNAHSREWQWQEFEVFSWSFGIHEEKRFGNA